LDVANNKVGFTGGSTVDNLPTHEDPKGLSGWGVFFIVLAVIAVVGGLGVYIYIRMRNKRLEGDLTKYS
jgi:hypothetical protein